MSTKAKLDGPTGTRYRRRERKEIRDALQRLANSLKGIGRAKEAAEVGTLVADLKNIRDHERFMERYRAAFVEEKA